MKKSIIFAVILFALMALMSSCNSTDSPQPDTSWLDTTEVGILEMVAEAPQPKIIIPERVGVSEMEFEFIPTPQCDGGACARVQFEIAILAENGVTYPAEVYVSVFRHQEDGNPRVDPEILAAKKLHKKLFSLTMEEIKSFRATLLNEELVQVITIERWDGNTFIPSQVIWEKKTY